MKFEIIPIVKIDSYEATKEPVFDIEVDNDHSFCVGDGIVVHNSVCTTRIKTGFGVPQITAIMDCVRASGGKDVIADGGIRTPGDVVKSIVAGASAVMIGGMLSGCRETPPVVKTISEGRDIIGDIEFRGMASREAFEDYFGGELPEWKTAEGISTFVPYKGLTESVIKDIVGGLRSALTYAGAENLAALRRNTEMIQITSSGYQESQAHILNK